MNRRTHLLPLFLFSPDGVATGGGAASSPEAPVMGTPDPNLAPEGGELEPEPISPNATIQELRDELGRAQRRLSEVIGEKRKLQGEKRTLTADAAALASYRNLGTPEELAARLKAGDDAISDQNLNVQRTNLAQACEVVGIDADALASLDGALGVGYLIEGEGEQKTAFVTFKEGDKDVKKPLAEWAKSKWPKLEAALFSGSGEVQTPVFKPATPYLRSAPVASNSPKNEFDEIRERKRKEKEGATPQKSWMEQAGVQRS